MVRISFLSHHILSDLHIVSFITMLRHGGPLSEAYLELRELYTKKIWKINQWFCSKKIGKSLVLLKKIWKIDGFASKKMEHRWFCSKKKWKIDGFALKKNGKSLVLL